jgi:hypothetical protein
VNLSDLLSSGVVGLIFVLIFSGLIVASVFINRKKPGPKLREIPAFSNLERAFGLSVEAGKRLHVSLGWGNLSLLQGASALIGLSLLQRITRFASVSDRPPTATSGNGTLMILSQDTLQSVDRSIAVEGQEARLTGLTPFSYAAGVLPVVIDEPLSAQVLAGHFGSEVALIAEAAEARGTLTLAGSDSLPSQAILYAAAQEPLLGEELYAAGAYLQAGRMHFASLYAQDVLRWGIVAVIVIGAALKLLGVL